MSEKRLEKIQQEIQEELLRELEQGVSFSDEQMQDEIEIRVLKRGQMEYLTIEEKMELVKKIFNSVRRLDVLQELLEDQDITEIMINGPDHIFIEKGGRLLDSGKKFPSQAKLEDVIQQIVSKVNRVVNEASPIVDVRLLDGSRVNVVLPPVALDGPVMTIRRFPENPFDMDKLLELGSITKEAAVFLRTLVEARYNIFISGGTGSGKTTFLNALSNYIPSTERIVTIEDSAELQIQNIANLVRLETRNANLEGKNEITVRDLVRSALRQRPEGIKIKKGKLKRKKKRIPIPHTFLQHILGNLIPFIRCEAVKIIEEADDLLSLFHSVLHVEGILPIHGICTQHSFPE